jgi:hypothetical protein
MNILFQQNLLFYENKLIGQSLRDFALIFAPIAKMSASCGAVTSPQVSKWLTT